MIIDLSIPRLFLKDKFNEVIFNARMKGYSLNKHQIAAVFTALMILGYNDHALACEGAAGTYENLKINTYSVIFALIETLKFCTLNDLKNMSIYFSNIRK